MTASVPCSVRVQASTAMFPGLTYEDAMAALVDAVEPIVGVVHRDHVQLCPQSSGVLDVERARRLREAHPHSRFRLHANVRVQEARVVRDAGHVLDDPAYFAQIQRVHEELGACTYSLHAGRRRGPASSLDVVFDNVRRLEDAFGAIVAVEGLYPDNDRSFHLDDWDSYARLLSSEVHFAIDLSHLHIVATRWGTLPTSLVRELLACERCVEVHVSGNDGFRDQHRQLERSPWWLPLLESVHPEALVFTESDHRRNRS